MGPAHFKAPCCVAAGGQPVRHNGENGGNASEYRGWRKRGDVCAVPHFNHELFVHVVVFQGKPEAGALRSRLFCFAIVGN